MFSIEIEAGDVYEHRTAGGGGWGDPLERDPAAVADDVPEREGQPRRRPAGSTASWSTDERIEHLRERRSAMRRPTRS